jgi:hypothetical protein
MAMPRGVAAIAAIVALACGGCFGYTRGAKGWSYVGDAVLIAGGGAAIALDETQTSTCEGMGCPKYTAPVSGGIVAGTVLITAGIVGILLNATRPKAKSASQGR